MSIDRSCRVAVILALLLLSGAGLAAQTNRYVTWKVLTPTITGRPGDVVRVKVQATIAPGSHMYSTKVFPADTEGPQTTEITVGEKNLLVAAGAPIADKRVTRKIDENFDNLEIEYWSGTVTFTIPVKIARGAPAGVGTGWVNFMFMTCTETTCQPTTDKRLELTVKVKPGSAKSSQRSQMPDAPETVGEKTAAGDVVPNPDQLLIQPATNR